MYREKKVALTESVESVEVLARRWQSLPGQCIADCLKQVSALHIAVVVDVQVQHQRRLSEAHKHAHGDRN